MFKHFDKFVDVLGKYFLEEIVPLIIVTFFFGAGLALGLSGIFLKMYALHDWYTIHGFAIGFIVKSFSTFLAMISFVAFKNYVVMNIYRIVTGKETSYE